jgi:hypothetical protein
MANASSDRRFDADLSGHPASPEAHLFEVELSIGSPPPGALTLSLPAWIPGSYMIRDFARNLVRIAAEDASGRPWRWSSATSRPGSCRSIAAAAAASGCAGRSSPGTSRCAPPTSTPPTPTSTARPLAAGAWGSTGPAGRAAPPPARPMPTGGWPPACPPGRRAPGLRHLPGRGLRGPDRPPGGDGPLHPGALRGAGVPHAMAISGRHRADEARLASAISPVCEQHAASSVSCRRPLPVPHDGGRGRLRRAGAPLLHQPALQPR